MSTPAATALPVDDATALAARLTGYCRARLGWADATVRGLTRATGGISRDTWIAAIDGLPVDQSPARSIVLRVDPAASILPSGRHTEAACLRAFADTDVPVPRVLAVEDDTAPLGASFMLTQLIPGTASPAAVVELPYRTQGSAIGRSLFETLARIGSHPADALLAAELDAPACSPAAHALEHWCAVLDEHSIGPSPVIAAAVRRLRRTIPPDPPRLAIVHGDYRLGNVMYLTDGTISGVLDWEMAHLGDPLEDLAWALHPAWRPSGTRDLVSGHLTEREAIEAFDGARDGSELDPAGLRWWRLFSHVKAAALWTTVAHHFLAGRTRTMTVVTAAWQGLSQDERDIADLLERSAR